MAHLTLFSFIFILRLFWFATNYHQFQTFLASIPTAVCALRKRQSSRPMMLAIFERDNLCAQIAPILLTIWAKQFLHSEWVNSHGQSCWPYFRAIVWLIRLHQWSLTILECVFVHSECVNSHGHFNVCVLTVILSGKPKRRRRWRNHGTAENIKENGGNREIGQKLPRLL